MSRSLPHGVVGAVVLGLACQILAAPAPARGQDVAEDAKAAALKERDRLRGESQKLRAAGKTAEAVAASCARRTETTPDVHICHAAEGASARELTGFATCDGG